MAIVCDYMVFQEHIKVFIATFNCCTLNADYKQRFPLLIGGGGVIFDEETKQRQQELLVWAIVVCHPHLLQTYQDNL